MGLLLSVLVACVGVLEVIACVRHFQDGYLPLWTPHCAVTSGYTRTHERSRKKPSEFRSSSDINDALYQFQDRSPEAHLHTSPSFENCYSASSILENKESVQNLSDVGQFNGGERCVISFKENQEIAYIYETDVSETGELNVISADDNELYIPNTENLERKQAEIISHVYTTNKQSTSIEETDLEHLSLGLVNENNNSLIENHGESYLTPDEGKDISILQHELEIPISENLAAEKLQGSQIEDNFGHECSALLDYVVAKTELPPQTLKEEVQTEEILQSENREEFVPESTAEDKYEIPFVIEGEKVFKINSESLISDMLESNVPNVSNTSALEETHFQTDSTQDYEEKNDYEVESQTIYSVDNTIEHMGHEQKSVNSGLEECEQNTIQNYSNDFSNVTNKIEDPSTYVLVETEKADLEAKEVVILEKDTQKSTEEKILDGQIKPEEFENEFVIDEKIENAGEEEVEQDESVEEEDEEEEEEEEKEETHMIDENLKLKMPVEELKERQNVVLIEEEKEESNVKLLCENQIKDENLVKEQIKEICAEELETFSIEGGVEEEVAEDEMIEDEDEDKSVDEASQSKVEEQVESNLFKDKIEDIVIDKRIQEMGDYIEDKLQLSEVNDECSKVSKIETTLSLRELNAGDQQEVNKLLPESEISSTVDENETLLEDDGHVVASVSRLDAQMTSTETDLQIDEESEDDGEFSIPQTECVKSIPKPHVPLTIDTSSDTLPMSRHSHQSSMSPPQVPSTPTRKSKADISWPTFFPGAPVIKRPSVSFATPEAVFTSEDQELLRQYAEEAGDITPIIKKTESSFTTDQESSSVSEEKSFDSTETSERSDSFEEVVPITFKERSPSNIVSGNDFSRKELALQRRKSYKHKRYSSATEIASKDEETEDRSFSENRPGITRASSLKEPKRRYRKPAKASSFEDVMLRDVKCATFESEAASVPVLEEKEGDTLHEAETDKDEFSDQQRVSTDSKVQGKDKENVIEEKCDLSANKEQDEEEEDYSASEEQSSSQQKSPANQAFWLIFSGEYTKAMSKDWHSGHFCCWQCDESLTGQRYVLRDEHPYCIKCYESVFANVCEECNKTIGIDSKDLSYKDKHWHEACFLCNKCRVSLVDKQFGSKADKIYCGNCYDAQFASRCDGCGEIFRAGTKKMEYKTRQWHEKCFCCCVCKTAIGTKSFIPREQEIYCATCYEEKFATRCVKCNKIITSGGVTYKNEPWHRECFTCTHCNTSLAGQRFTSRDEKPYCADCFGELFAKRCTACSKPITGIGGTRFISFEDRHWHNDCFICAQCKTSLVGRGFITDAEDIICPDCAKQKLM